MTDNQKRIKVAVAIVKNPKGKVLITERSGNEPVPSSRTVLWMFPGINVEESEDPERTLVSAVKHKTGYKIKVDKLLGERDHPEFFEHTYYYACSIDDFHVKPIEFIHETRNVKWADPEELKDHFKTSIGPMVADYLEIEAFPAKE